MTAACHKVNEECLSLSSLDNMTSMIVLFGESAQSGVEVTSGISHGVDPSNEKRMC